jgi:hypothetical protein
LLRSAKFSVVLDRGDLILTGAPVHADDPFLLRRATNRNRVGETVTLVRRDDAVLCGMTRDCAAMSASGRHKVCTADGAYGLGFCMDVRRVPTPEVPAALPGYVGSYVLPRFAADVSPGQDLLKPQAGEVGTRMLTLLPNGKVQLIWTSLAGHVRFEWGTYQATKTDGVTQLVLKVANGEPVRLELAADGSLQLPSNVPAPRGRALELIRTDRTALCESSSDCAMLSATRPGVAWLCEIHNLNGIDPVGVCVDAAERGRTPEPLICD